MEPRDLSGRIAPVNSLRMYYELHGQGDPLVLLHGFNVSGAIWKPFIAPFSRHHRLIVPDLRGHGRTDNPSGAFSHRLAAQDLFALLDHLNIDAFRAIGTSSGGMLLLHAALQQPARLKAMILVGATYYYPHTARAVMRQRTPETLTPDILDKLRGHHRLGDDQIRTLHALFHSFKDNYDDDDMDIPPARLATINIPTLIVHGDRDTYFPLSIAVDLFQAIPNARLWIVPNGNHIPIFDPPETFAQTALSFLRGELTTDH